MPDGSPRRALTLLLALALFAPSCGGGRDGGRPIATLELVDFTAAGMFRQLSVQLGRPYLLELPSTFDTTQRDLRMEDSNERAVLEELCRLDPAFQHDMGTAAWMLFPAGEEAATSPFSKRVESFSVDGSVFSALQQLIAQGLSPDTGLVIGGEGKARPVRLSVKGATVRELLAEIAAQGQLGIVVEPGTLRVSVVPE